MDDSSDIQALLNLQPYETVLDLPRSSSNLVLRPGGPQHSLSSIPRPLLHQFRLDGDGRRRRKPKPQPDHATAPLFSKFGVSKKHTPHVAAASVAHSDAQQPTEPAEVSLVALGDSIGAASDPFDVLPTFDIPMLGSTQELLFDFRSRYGHFHASKIWQGAMLTDRAACLSFLNIVVMCTKLTVTGSTSVQTLAARLETVRILNSALRRSSTQTSNSTLMSLNHMLVSELCAADRATINMHVRGSEQAIHIRGGFDLMDRLGGLERECAARNQYSILVACAMHNLRPNPATMSYMPSPVANIFENYRFCTMESPLYHEDDAPLIPPGAEDQPERLLWLLYGCRMLTELLLEEIDLAEFGYADEAPPHRLGVEQMNQIYADLLSQPSMHATGEEISGNLQYEAVRLTALIFSTSILCNVPFSAAADMPPLRLKEPNIREELCNVFRALVDDPDFDRFIGVALWQILVCASAIGPPHFIQSTCIDPETRTFKPLPMKFFESFYSSHHVAVVRSMKTLCRLQTALGANSSETAPSFEDVGAANTIMSEYFVVSPQSSQDSGFAEEVEEEIEKR